MTQHPKDQRTRLRIVLPFFLTVVGWAVKSGAGWPAALAFELVGLAAIWWFTRNLPGPESEPVRPDA